MKNDKENEKKSSIKDRMSDTDGFEFNFSSGKQDDDTVLVHAINAVTEGVKGLKDDVKHSSEE